MGSSSKSHTTSTNCIRYAPYVEGYHTSFLSYAHSYMTSTVGQSPFSGYTDIEVDEAFFGVGYVIASFPSLYDMFGKFMAGLDIEILWTQIFEDTVNSSVVSTLVAAEGELIDDEIDSDSVPRLQTGMRDINAVMSSTFVVGKSIIEDTRTKLLSKFSADLKYKLIPVAQERWQSHLNWNKVVIGTYAEIMKLYYSVKTDIDEINYAMAAKNLLWPFTVLDYERAALGALQGATNSKQDVAGASTASRVISGALSGAAMGAMIGSQVGGTTTSIVGGVANTVPTTYGGLTGGAWGAAGGAILGAAAALTY